MVCDIYLVLTSRIISGAPRQNAQHQDSSARAGQCTADALMLISHKDTTHIRRLEKEKQS